MPALPLRWVVSDKSKRPAYAAEFASRKYIELVESLGRALGGKHGWKTEAAELLGVHASFVNKIAAGKVHRISDEIVQRAQERLGIYEYFWTSKRPWHDCLDLRPRKTWDAGRAALIDALADRASAAEQPPDAPTHVSRSTPTMIAMRLYTRGMLGHPIDASDAHALADAILALPVADVLRRAAELKASKGAPDPRAVALLAHELLRLTEPSGRSLAEEYGDFAATAKSLAPRE